VCVCVSYVGTHYTSDSSFRSCVSCGTWRSVCIKKILGSYVFITAVETAEKQVLFWEMKSRPGHDASVLNGYA